jgi:hypothetical protein
MVINDQGNTIFRFAVNHGKTKKHEVKGVYVKQFLEVVASSLFE